MIQKIQSSSKYNGTMVHILIWKGSTHLGP